MSINVSSAKVMNSLYNNNNGTTTFYTGISSRSTIKVNTDVENSISANSEFQRAVRGLKRCNFETGLKSEIKKYTKKLVDSLPGDGGLCYRKKQAERVLSQKPAMA